MAERTTRENSSREAKSRRKQWQNPNTLLDPEPKDGLAYRWVRKSLLGQDDAKNVSSKFREGWEPVNPTEHPEFAEFHNQASDTIEYGGLVLCCTDEEVVEQRNSHYQGIARQQLESVDNDYLRENDSRMPKLAPERKTTTTFGSGSGRKR